jgi:hypothetical protein
MVFADSSEMSLSIRNAVRHLKQLGKYDLNENIFQCFYFYKKGESFHTNIFTEDDVNNIDYVADTLMALVNKICF